MPTQPDNIDWDDERTTDREAVVGAGAYNRYQQDHSYSTDTGLLVLPLSSKKPDFKIIRLHGGIQTRTVDWVACRQGKPPIIPSAVDTEFDKYLGGTVTVGLPVPNKQQNGYNWTVSGSYLYVEAAPRVPGVNTLPTGNAPYATEPMDSTANAGYLANAAAITAGFQALADAPAAADPVAPIDVVGQAVSGGVDHLNDQYIWPYTFFPPIFSTDTGIDT